MCLKTSSLGHIFEILRYVITSTSKFGEVTRHSCHVALPVFFRLTSFHKKLIIKISIIGFEEWISNNSLLTIMQNFLRKPCVAVQFPNIGLFIFRSVVSILDNVNVLWYFMPSFDLNMWLDFHDNFFGVPKILGRYLSCWWML